jgi:exopolysaccharide biosynthesis protein
MKIRILNKYIALLFFIILFSCSKSSNGGSVTPPIPTPPIPTPPTVITTPKLMSLPSGWKFSSIISANFPSGIELYFFDSIYAGKKTKMYCLAYDSKNTSIEFKPVLSTTAKRTSDFYKDETGIVYAAINGGYFGSNQSYSLVKYNGAVSSANIKVLSRTFNGVSNSYYPTRAAFGVTANGTYESAWIYHVGTGNNLIYSYPSPNLNVEGKAPMPMPTELFPIGGMVWNINSAIGGSPHLLKSGKLVLSDTAEMIVINNKTSRPRSAIGYTNNNLVLLLAVEGDNSVGGYEGVNLLDLSNILVSLGCQDAINLDGGGSTSMVVSSQQLVRPGDNGIERPVISAVLIKKK